MTREASSTAESDAPIEKAEKGAPSKHGRGLPAWLRLREDSVPVRRIMGHAEDKERAARLRLVVPKAF